MIIPVGNENDSVRRLPWVTFAIMAVCLITHLFVNAQVNEMEKELGKAGQIYIEYYLTHPYLEMDPQIAAIFFSDPAQKAELDRLVQMYGKEEPFQYIKEDEQEELNALGKKFLDTLKTHPLRKWGFTPAQRSLKTQFTSMFLHVDWWHLIFNMLFLYISAPFIEDAWGRPMFAVFYVIMGLVSAQAHAFYYPTSTVPLVGASGAVAGVMGAFLVRFWNVKLKFIYFFSIWIRGTFSAPAWLMLPLWVIEEFVSAKFADSASTYGGSGGGVAHWVHVWGFVFGFVVALVIKFLKVEEKFIAPKILAETTYVNETLSTYEKAMETLASGEKEEAYNMLFTTAKKDPRNTDILNALWPLSIELHKPEEVAPFLQRQVDTFVRNSQAEAAMPYFFQLREHIPGARFSFITSTIMLQQLIAENKYVEAEQFALEIGGEVNMSIAPGVLIDYCNVLSRIDLELNRTHAQKYIQLALKHPDIPDSAKEDLKKRVFEKSSRPQASTEILSAGGAMAAGIVAAAAKVMTPNVAVPPPVPNEMTAGPMFSLDQFDTQPPPPPPFPVNLRAMDARMPPPIPESVETIVIQPPPIPDFAKAQATEVIQREPVFTLDFSTVSASPIPEASTVKVEKPPVFVQQKIIKPTYTAPLEILDGRLSLDVDGVGQRALPFAKIKAMAVVKIAAPGQSAYLLMDMFLDEPNTLAAATPQAPVVDVRSLRITSNRFNPVKLIPKAKSAGEAFRVFAAGLQKLSKALPYPDLETVQLKKVLIFPSVELYEDGIFTATPGENK